MHKWAKEILECVKSKISSRGLDNLQHQELEEFKLWTEISANIAKADYYYHITDAMEKPENEYGINYDENGRYYTGQPRNSQGEFMRRGYVHDPIEHYRDMDYPMGRMYYSDGGNMGSSYSGNGGSSNNRGYQESRYERARRGYEESKQMNPGMDNMAAIEQVFDAFEMDIKELKPKMTSNEKSIARNKLTNISNMMM